MPGTVAFEDGAAVARVTLANPGKHNAIDIAMWRELRALFERLQARPAADAPRALVVCGAGGQFAAGDKLADGIKTCLTYEDCQKVAANIQTHIAGGERALERTRGSRNLHRT